MQANATVKYSKALNEHAGIHCVPLLLTSSPYCVSGDVRVKEEREEEEVSRLKRDLGSARKTLERVRQDKKAMERELQVCVHVSV